MTRKDALGCVGGRARLREESCARSRDDAWSGLLTGTDQNVDSHRGPHCALLDRSAWECPPSRGDA
ncbi:hypothetical protein CRG98_009949 [Punica granatum]|uniref:Uncharacterized protein n=1 Tax=Punica granatum TaxID=22663 RepID=A0A2I0KMH2_PUNGR|nr:hypothetical protein CRG98_009949 [Punica granatum]